MPSSLRAVVATVVVVVAGALPVAAGQKTNGDAVVSERAMGGLRTDRLSRKELKTWAKIEAVVMAEDAQGQPWHPTLRGLWEAVDSSGHAVYVEVVRDGKSAIAGRFEVTEVDPDGVSHEARLLLNLRALDRVSTTPAAARANGFIPFEDLEKTQRQAELLGHELAHAAWHLESVERARIAERIHRDKERLAQKLLAAPSAEAREALMVEARAADRFGRRLEESAEAAEMEIWSELRAAQDSL
jgi:hypothetical protein